MRQIGTIADGQQAEQFADYLRGQGVACSLDEVAQGWAVWVQNEDQVPTARQELQSFQENPQLEKYRLARQQADTKLREEFQKRKAARQNRVSVRQQWDRPLGERCPLTIGLLATCAVVAFFTRLGGDFVMPGEKPEDFIPLLQKLWISPNGSWRAVVRDYEVWRIWSPMLIHYGWMHIIFNGFWLRDFGMWLEDRLGTWRFFLLVLIVGAVSHILQFELGALNLWKLTSIDVFRDWSHLPKSYGFGGMSGVNYGLFGYLWMRGKLDPRSGLGVSEQTVLWMIVWFFVCWTGLVGPVANWAHAGGLAAGVGCGAVAAWWANRR